MGLARYLRERNFFAGRQGKEYLIRIDGAMVVIGRDGIIVSGKVKGSKLGGELVGFDEFLEFLIRNSVKGMVDVKPPVANLGLKYGKISLEFTYYISEGMYRLKAVELISGENSFEIRGDETILELGEVGAVIRFGEGRWLCDRADEVLRGLGYCVLGSIVGERVGDEFRIISENLSLVVDKDMKMRWEVLPMFGYGVIDEGDDFLDFIVEAFFDKDVNVEDGEDVYFDTDYIVFAFRKDGANLKFLYCAVVRDGLEIKSESNKLKLTYEGRKSRLTFIFLFSEAAKKNMERKFESFYRYYTF